MTAGIERGSRGEREVVAVVPAAGLASRVGPLPVSKEVFPVGFQVETGEGARSVRPKVACEYLLERMRLAGAAKAYLVLRSGKWDVPAYLGDGSRVGMHLAYLMMGLPYGPPYTVDQAYPFVREATVLFGFPDVIFQPDDAFVQLLAHQATTQAAAVLGLFPTDQPQNVDMVDLADEGRVREIVIKPRQTDLRYTWMIAVWTPEFTQFMHDYLAALPAPDASDQADPELPAGSEVHVGHVIQAAIDRGLPVESVLFAEGFCLDIGTPENLHRAVRMLSAPGGI